MSDYILRISVSRETTMGDSGCAIHVQRLMWSWAVIDMRSCTSQKSGSKPSDVSTSVHIQCE
jgi:hypothetical protein